MKRALVISSQVAASSVGVNNSAFCLRRLGIDTVILPTTLMGRHPGWGTPGGTVAKAQILSDMWDGIRAQNLRFDAVMTGYMGSVENVELAGKILSNIKEANPKTIAIVDPVMGDNDRLYVPVDVAEAIMGHLISQADIVTPNVWEFSHILKRELPDLKSVEKALLDYGGCALVTSVRHHGRIGALSYHPGGLTYFGHEEFERVPNGGGDALSGILLAHILNGKTEEEAARAAVSSVFEIMQQAVDNDSAEFPLTRFQASLEQAPLLGMERLI